MSNDSDSENFVYQCHGCGKKYVSEHYFDLHVTACRLLQERNRKIKERAREDRDQEYY